MGKKMKRAEKGVSTFSKILTTLMAEKEVGVREAARIAGVGPSTLVSWRAGALPEDYIAVRKLAHHFGVTLGYLLTGEDDTRPADGIPAISEVFQDGGILFDGYAKILVQRLVPKLNDKKRSNE
ncbi:MAG: hypothetical protein HY074_03035 [Deltaproteobacteria bacterium]|nr:hypothetical protein [Deltaproteobacteria bacterium]